MDITNPEVKALDVKVADLYKLVGRYRNRTANKYGKEIYNRETGDLFRQLDSARPESDFDALIIKNARSNLRIQERVFDFLTDPSYALSVEEFYDSIAGKGAYQHLEDRVRDGMWKLQWEQSEKRKEIEVMSIDLNMEEAKEAAKIWIPAIKEEVLEYGKKEGYLPPEFDMQVFLLPPPSGLNKSYWNSANKTLALGICGFDIIASGNGVRAIPIKAYRTAFHEIIGHASHQVHSEGLPLSVRFTEDIGNIAATKSVTEGVAKHREKEAFNFLSNNLGKFKIGQDDLDFQKNERELQMQGLCERMYGCLLREKSLREKGFDVYQHVLKVTESPEQAKEYSDYKEEFYYEGYWMLGHVLGWRHYARMEEIVRNEMGYDYIEKNKDKFNKAAATGVWSWEVYPEAVIYFLRHKSR